MARLKLEYVGKGEGQLGDEDLVLQEVVVPESSRLAGDQRSRSACCIATGSPWLASPGRGADFATRFENWRWSPVTCCFCLDLRRALADVKGRLGLLPLADRGHSVIKREKVWLAVGTFAAAIAVASFGWVYLPIALGCVAAIYVLSNIVPIRDVYTSIEWPVIVLLGSMIPIGGALQSTGGTALIAGGIVDISAGFSPVVVLTLLVVVTMTLSDVMNNTATAVIAAPIAVEIASRARRQSRSVSHGSGSRGVVRFPDADWPQEQYADHGAGRVSLW